MGEGQDAEHVPREVMRIADAAKLLGVSEDTVRRWIDENEPTREHPDRVPVAERARTDQGPVAGRWRRPYRDAVEAWARRQGRLPRSGADTPPGDTS